MKISQINPEVLAVDEWSSKDFSLLGKFPYRGNWRDETLLIPCKSANIAYLVNHFVQDNVQWDEQSLKLRDEFLKDKISIAKIKSNLKYTYKRAPMKHQQKAFDLSAEMINFGLFMEQGTGKTKVILDTASYLYLSGQIDMLIVIAWPNGVHRNWVDNELHKDISPGCPYKAEFWTSSPTKKKIKRV